MLVTDDGISRRANELHLPKALSPMLVTDDGISRLASELHSRKASFPMLVTDDGIVTRVTLVLSTPHSFHESTSDPRVMEVVPSGIAKCTPPWSLYAADAAAAAILGRPSVAY